jgi:mannose-6-phosphate isomerase
MSESPALYPLLFEPVLKDFVWGGRALAERLGRTLPPGPVAESWEIAAHAEGASVVINGRWAGQPLTAVHAALGLDLIGTANDWAQARGLFPLLVKLLDAHDKLSVQVHPGDEYALAHEGNELGKTEMWVVLHAEPDARVILGVKAGTTANAFRAAIAAGTLEQCLHSVPIAAGDHVCVPSGTVHAIMGGALIAEIQQNSNTTYRVYDWNRAPGGRPRPLHVDKALDVIDFAQAEPMPRPPELIEAQDGRRRSLLCRNRYFTVERVELEPGACYEGVCDGYTLEIWGTLAGEVTIASDAAAFPPVDLAAVGFALLPATLGAFRVSAREASVCLRCYVEG